MLYGLLLYSVESFKYSLAGKSISKETKAVPRLDFFHKPGTKPGTNRCDRVHQPSATKTIGFYTSTLAVITIATIFATLRAISKSAKLLDYSSVLSTFGTLFLCLITNSLKDPGYHGCSCRMSCNGSPCCHMAGVYFVNRIID